MRHTIGRRMFLALPAASLLRGQPAKAVAYSFPPQHFLDPATELDVYRLTEPQANAYTSPPSLRFVSRRGHFFLSACDRSGALQAWRTDWKSGESRLLTNAAALDRTSLALSSDDRTAFCFDGSSLLQVSLANSRQREIARVPSGWVRSPGFSLSPDGTTAAWVERQADRSRLQVLHIARAAVSTAVETAGVITDPQLRPARAQVVYRAADQAWLVNLDGEQNRRLRLSGEGAIGQMNWNPSGRTLLYLSAPTDRKQLVTLREHTPDENSDQLVAKTSQFGLFGVNGDASVFVGASRNLASPYVLLLLRVARRELTLCEHRASDPQSVFPVFSPDSQDVFFSSDRQGKHAIYRVHVGRFVEETGDEG